METTNCLRQGPCVHTANYLSHRVQENYVSCSTKGHSRKEETPLTYTIGGIRRGWQASLRPEPCSGSKGEWSSKKATMTVTAGK